MLNIKKKLSLSLFALSHAATIATTSRSVQPVRPVRRRNKIPVSSRHEGGGRRDRKFKMEEKERTCQTTAHARAGMQKGRGEKEREIQNQICLNRDL